MEEWLGHFAVPLNHENMLCGSFVERSTKEAALRKKLHVDKRLVFNLLLFNRVDMKNILRLIYANSTVVELWKYSILFNLIFKYFPYLDKKHVS